MQTRNVHYVVEIEIFLARAFNFNFNSGDRDDDIPYGAWDQPVILAHLDFHF